MAGIYRELWTGRVLEQLNDHAKQQAWLSKIPDYSALVGNAVIHMTQLAGIPTVYRGKAVDRSNPLTAATLTDTDLTKSLVYYRTQPTDVTVDELYALSYEKMQTVTERHAKALAEAQFTDALWNIAPESAVARDKWVKGGLPIVATTGATDANRKTLTLNDILNLKLDFDKRGFPTEGRVLVLCPEHEHDLLALSSQYNGLLVNFQGSHDGSLPQIYGFSVCGSQFTPRYATVSGATKKVCKCDGTKADGQAYSGSTTATAMPASIAFCSSAVFKCSMAPEFFYAEAHTQPLIQCSTVAYKQYWLADRIREEGAGVITGTYQA